MTSNFGSQRERKRGDEGREIERRRETERGETGRERDTEKEKKKRRVREIENKRE